MQYAGSQFPQRENELQRIQNISSALSQREPALYSKKWWDYRLLHPTQATYLFAHHYRQSLRLTMDHRVDRSKLRFVRGLREFTFDQDLNKAFVTGMWKARQTADEHGVPYDTWCFGAMKYAEKNLWKYPPKPCHLYGSSVKEEHAHFKTSMLDFILKRWVDTLGNSMKTATSNFYTVPAYCGHPYQFAHMKFLKGQLLVAPHPAFAVAELMYEKNILAEGNVRNIFGDRAERVLAESRLYK